MSGAIISASGLRRRFGETLAMDGVDLELQPGSVLGLIGPNGAGKTTLLRSLLGLTRSEGQLTVLGLDPRREQTELMRRVSFIADTAVLPRWMTVAQLLDYVNGVHPNFDRARAESFLASTEVMPRRAVRELSKGMTVQLHLALVMAIDARLLVLDEPTLGLDILFRKRFYEQLLNDYFDDGRSIVISTHQVEEVEHILTHVMFMHHGKSVLFSPMQALEENFIELRAMGPAVARAETIPHLGSRPVLGGRALIYEGIGAEALAPLGDLRTPTLSDLFVAKISGGVDHEIH